MHLAMILHKLLYAIWLTPHIAHIAAFFHKIAYAILLSPVARGRAARVVIKSNYGRLISTVHLVDDLIPGTASKLAQELYRNKSFPWTPVDIQLIACGSGAAVLKLHLNNEDKVLRIYRKSVGQSYRGALQIAQHYKKNYETMQALYGGSRGLVLPMQFMVLQSSPLLGPVAASLQPYIHGAKLDLFEDYAEHELLTLFDQNRCLREQFLYFAEQTIRQWDARDMCFDFLGRQNSMLVSEAGNHRIVLPDCGFFNFDLVTKEHPETMARLQQHMNRLVTLYELTKKLEYPPRMMELAF